MKKDEIKEILNLHEKWVLGEGGGKKADLSGAYLKNVNLEGAVLEGANLSEAFLVGANLRGANLCNTYLRNADLRKANLEGADLRGADLRNVDLRDANLAGVNFRGANLCDVELSKTNVDIDKVIYDGYTGFFAMQCPEEGSFIAWKKCKKCIVKLLIPEDAKRSSATTRKCRASKAKVLSIENIESGEEVKEVCSDYDETFIYKVGETVEVKDFNEDRWDECSTGIHFFITKQEAINY